MESEGNLGPNRMIQEDLALPVIIDPGVDSANPEVLDWRVVSTTQPNKAEKPRDVAGGFPKGDGPVECALGLRGHARHQCVQ